MPTIKKILIIKLWAMGDVIMATPMIDAIRKTCPDCVIVWVVDRNNAPILQGHPGIDDLVSVDTAQWRRQLKKFDVSGWLLTAISYAHQMKAPKFDAVINCHPDKWWTLVFCQARQRVALFPFEAPWASRLFYGKAISRPRTPPIHNSVHYLLATRSLGFPDGKMDLSIGPQQPEESRERSMDDFGQLRIVVAPFSTGENRNWPLERYGLLVGWLVNDLKAKVQITIGPTEISRLSEIEKAVDVPGVQIEDHLTAEEYVAVIQAADLVISGDSSPMHIAAATDVPFVALFGATPVNERAPIVGAGKVIYKPLPCSPCDQPTCANSEFRKCMTLIELEDVKNAILAVLKSTSGSLKVISNESEAIV